MSDFQIIEYSIMPAKHPYVWPSELEQFMNCDHFIVSVFAKKDGKKLRFRSVIKAEVFESLRKIVATQNGMETNPDGTASI